MKRSSRPVLALLFAFAAWLPLLHVVDAPSQAELARPIASDRARGLLGAQLALWETDAGDAERARLRATNPEWDLMSRTFLVMALADVVLVERDPDLRQRDVHVMDVVLDDTLAAEAEHGHEWFLLPYAHRAPFVGPRGIRSVFVDGEIAMMMAVREIVGPRPDLDALLTTRVERIHALMEAAPLLSAESYPDECWTFCNTLALAALRVADVARGTDESADLARRWIASAREHLVDTRTGLLVSSYTYDGRALDGPEGTSIFMAAHDLVVLDPDFAHDQWLRARAEIGESLLGFGWAREWPRSWESPSDVDSGPIVPFVDASAGASGMAILGASAFSDRAYLGELLTTLDFAAFPIVVDDDSGGERMRYAASNAVGDAVLLYALTYGPLWERVGAAEPARELASREVTR